MFRQWSILLVLAGAFCALPANAEESIVVSAVVGRYDDIRENLVFAIEGRGLVINNVAHVGDMLARTAADIGKSKRIYGQAEVLEFCSAGISRTMMETDPHYIVYCPYTIAVYTLPDQPDKVFLSYRPLPPGPGLDGPNKLLKEIMADAQH